jgi:prophage antirepressor-like protein
MEITMNHPNSQLIETLLFQTHPVHLFEYNGKPAFIAQEVGQILELKDASKSVRQLRAVKEPTDYDVIPVNTICLTDKLSATYEKQAPLITILYLSGLIMFVARTNKKTAIPFIRWVIQKAIPLALKQKPALELSQKTRAMLAAHGWIDPATPKQPTDDGGQP